MATIQSKKSKNTCPRPPLARYSARHRTTPHKASTSTFSFHIKGILMESLQILSVPMLSATCCNVTRKRSSRCSGSSPVQAHSRPTTQVARFMAQGCRRAAGVAVTGHFSTLNNVPRGGSDLYRGCRECMTGLFGTGICGSHPLHAPHAR